MQFGAIIIGDEILSGKRQDKHFTQLIKILGERGLALSWCNYLGDDPGGLVLDAGLADRWVMLTFNDSEVSQAAKLYEARKKLVHGLHFLLVTPDDSGITDSGIWLLQS